MTDWKKILDESKMAAGVVRSQGKPFCRITGNGSLTLSGAVRRDILARRQDVHYLRPRFHEGERMVLLEFLPKKELGARKISGMQATSGTASVGFRSFLAQMGLTLEDVIGKYPLTRVEDLDGEWWMFRLDDRA